MFAFPELRDPRSRIYETTGHETNGTLQMNTQAFRYIAHANHPNHVAPRVVYNPSSDRREHVQPRPGQGDRFEGVTRRQGVGRYASRSSTTSHDAGVIASRATLPIRASVLENPRIPHTGSHLRG